MKTEQKQDRQAEPGFTPGPWTVTWHCPLEKGGTYKANYKIGYCSGPREAKANARLISAAPDLLYALQGAVSHLENLAGELNDEEQILNAQAEIRIARAALAKAEGRSL